MRPLPALDQIDPAVVDQTLLDLAQALGEAYPDVDLARGFVHDVFLRVAAAVAALLRTQADRLNAGTSLAAIRADPTLADDDAVDLLLSNYRVTRLPGVAASGLVTIVVSAPTPLVVPSGGVFAAGTATFATAAAYAVRASADQVAAASDRVLRPVQGGYAFSVPVTAAAAGASGMLRRGQAVVPGFAIPGLVRAYAEGDFTGGAAAETNAQLVARLLAGLAAPTFSGRSNVEALVRADPRFARLKALSIVGAGDPEMRRDRHGLFPVSCFGRVDVYARTADLPAGVALAARAAYVGPDDDGVAGLWRVALPRDAAPGLYEVARVAPAGAPQSDAGFAVVDDRRDVDLAGPWAPDVADPAEGAYSPYQTAAILYRDDRTPIAGLAPGATVDVDVTAVAMPQLADLQALLGGRDVRPAGGDVLVRAAVPCFLRVAVAVDRPALADPIDEQAVAAAVADWVNATGFPGRLRSSDVAAVALAKLPEGCHVAAVDLYGRVRRPDGTQRFLRDPLGAAIAVPDEPGLGVTARTVAFLLAPEDVTVSARVVPAGDA